MTHDEIESLWQQGRIAGPASKAWLKSLPPHQAASYIAKLGGLILNPDRAGFAPNAEGERDYRAYLKARGEGRVRIHGGRA